MMKLSIIESQVQNSPDYTRSIFLWLLILNGLIASQVNFVLPTIQDTIILKDWLTIGPFSCGVREPAISYLPETKDFVPFEGLTHRDILTQNGELHWHRVQSENGTVKIKGDSVNYDFIQDLYGVAGLFGVSYAYAEFENKGEKRALVIAERCNFRLNDQGFVGDPYGAGYVRIPVLLKDGKNKILVSVSGFGESEFRFKIIPAPHPVMAIYQDATVPDIIYEQELNSWLGLPIFNTTPRSINNVWIEIGDNRLIQLVRTTEVKIAPLCGKKVPLPLKTIQPIRESIPGDTILVPIKIGFANAIDSGYIKLRLRRLKSARKETFISKLDGSVQYYAILPPVGYSKEKEYALIFTLHGAGVEAISQVESYSPKDWAFIVAPTNRRPFGFDWQDWGRLDALEVLAIIKKLYSVNENRIYLVGHSMGGHGTWHIGLTHSDLFAAIAPSAGWTSHQIYLPWSLQKSLFFAQPDLLAIREKVLKEDNPLNFLANARNLPIYILQGSNDDNVPAIHARLFAKYLEAETCFRKAEFIYKEVAGVGHWWDNDTIPGTACVDYPDLMDFLKSKTRNPYPLHIHFKTTNLAQNNQHYWLTIDQLKKLYEEAIIDVQILERKIMIKTSNIQKFTLNLNFNLIPQGKIQIIVNNQKISYEIRSPRTTISLIEDTKGKWHITEMRKAKGEKWYNSYGPIKQAYFSPFVLVYGTKGDSAVTDLLLHQARLQALIWWLRANGYVDILPDTEVTQSTIDNYNLILFGNEKTNSIIARIQNKLPIKISERQVELNIVGRGQKGLKTQRLYGDLGVILVYPNPLKPDKLILIYAGTSEEGQKISSRFQTLYSGAGLPDFLIFDETVKEKGFSGIKAGGFFSNRWQLESDLIYLVNDSRH